jgi:DNA polymerase-4
VAANLSPGGCIISPSIEAKQLGIKVGFRVKDAQAVCPDIVIVAPDPDKYFHVHRQFSKIFRSYSPHVVPLSIDEAVIKFDGTLGVHKMSLEDIGLEIKQRMHDEVGDWIRCNVGIGTNRFLAKMAAGLHKPDGLDTLTAQNLRETYSRLRLKDLTGINTRNAIRLEFAGIYSPIEFLDAPVWKLWKQVFQSVQGYHWFYRLRGYEVDDISFKRRTYGQTYALHKFTDNSTDLSKLMMKLCEKMGRRLRRSGNYAQGIHVWCGYRGFPGWHMGRKFKTRLYSTVDLHTKAMELLERRPRGYKVTHIGVTCYDLKLLDPQPPQLFETPDMKSIRVAQALDKVNDRYGEYSVMSSRMFGLDGEIVKRVPFHATTDTLSEIYLEPDSA